MTDSEETTGFSPPVGPDEAELPEESPELAEIDPFETDPSEFDDINEFVTQEWRESTTARERVRDIIYRTSRPMTADEIADLAEVSSPTARSKLNDLSDEGTVLAESSQRGTVYQRDPDWYRLKRVQKLADKSHQTIESALQRLDREIRGYKSTYEAATPEDLIVESDELADDEWQDVSEWRTALVDRQYLKTALQLCQLRHAENQDTGGLAAIDGSLDRTHEDREESNEVEP